MGLTVIIGAEPTGHFGPFRGYLHHDDAAGTADLEELNHAEPDGTGTQDNGGVARFDSRLPDAVKGHGKRFHKGSLFKGHRIRKRTDHPIGLWDANKFCAGTGSVGCTADIALEVIGAQIVLAVATVNAHAAGRRRRNHHPVADLNTRGIGTDGGNDAGAFVPENGAHGVEVTTENGVDVGATNAAGLDFHQDFSCLDFGYGAIFDLDGLFSFKNRCFHGLRPFLGKFANILEIFPSPCPSPQRGEGTPKLTHPFIRSAAAVEIDFHGFQRIARNGVFKKLGIDGGGQFDDHDQFTD